MGFELVKVVVAPNPGEHGGWSKHFFSATNPVVSRDEGLMAFWELHDDQIVAEVDHGFCVSIYISDPNRNMVEFCHTTRPFTDVERDRAMQARLEPAPAHDGHGPKLTMWKPLVPVA